MLANSGQAKAKRRLPEISMAESREAAQRAFDLFLEAYGPKYDEAVACLEKGRDVRLTFYEFAAGQWQHIRSANPVERPCATVRLRTTKTKGCQLAEIDRGVEVKDGERLTEPAAGTLRHHLLAITPASRGALLAAQGFIQTGGDVYRKVSYSYSATRSYAFLIG